MAAPQRIPAVSDGDRLLAAIEDVVRFIVGLDLPQLPDDETEQLVGHLTGAVFIRVNDLLPLEPTTAGRPG
jgi:hypothetical protein